MSIVLRGRARHPAFVTIIAILTLGLYFLIWIWKTNEELQPAAQRPWPAGAALLSLSVATVAAWTVGAFGVPGLGQTAADADAGLLSVSSGLWTIAAVLLVFIEFRIVEVVGRAQRASRKGTLRVLPSYFLLLLLPIVGLPVLQMQINKIWEGEETTSRQVGRGKVYPGGRPN